MHSISLVQENQTSLKQHQQLLINLAMKQAFHVLQLPLLELSEWLKSEIEANPVLEMDESDEKEQLPFRNRSQEQVEKRYKEQQENLLTAPISLFEHLMKQVPLVIENRDHIHLAELIIGHLNHKGFLETPLAEIAPAIPLETMQSVLGLVQSLDPPGIGAHNLQECLLIQLHLKQKADSLAAQILRDHFDNLLHNRLPQIAQALQIPLNMLVEIVEKQIVPLDLYPGYRYFYQPAAAITPDLTLTCIDDKWQVEVNNSFLPHFRITPIYVNALQGQSLETEESSYLRRQLSGGRWLKRIVQRRHETLRRIAAFLLQKQSAFFNGEKPGLASVTIQEAAKELGLHESTIARAVANKFLACPQGLFALKSFFSQAVKTQSGRTISKHNLRQMLHRTIENEDKNQPLSDEQLASHFQKLGVPCARRTIAKYRTALKIAPAARRRKW